MHTYKLTGLTTICKVACKMDGVYFFCPENRLTDTNLIYHLWANCALTGHMLEKVKKFEAILLNK